MFNIQTLDLNKAGKFYFLNVPGSDLTTRTYSAQACLSPSPSLHGFAL